MWICFWLLSILINQLSAKISIFFLIRNQHFKWIDWEINDAEFDFLLQKSQKWYCFKFYSIVSFISRLVKRHVEPTFVQLWSEWSPLERELWCHSKAREGGIESTGPTGRCCGSWEASGSLRSRSAAPRKSPGPDQPVWYLCWQVINDLGLSCSIINTKK